MTANKAHLAGLIAKISRNLTAWRQPGYCIVLKAFICTFAPKKFLISHANFANPPLKPNELPYLMRTSPIPCTAKVRS